MFKFLKNIFKRKRLVAEPTKTLSNREQANRDRAKGAKPCSCGQMPIVIKKNDKVYEIGCVAHATRQVTFKAPTVEGVIELWNDNH